MNTVFTAQIEYLLHTRPGNGQETVARLTCLHLCRSSAAAPTPVTRECPPAPLQGPF